MSLINIRTSSQNNLSFVRKVKVLLENIQKTAGKT